MARYLSDESGEDRWYALSATQSVLFVVFTYRRDCVQPIGGWRTPAKKCGKPTSFFAKTVAGPTLGQVCAERPLIGIEEPSQFAQGDVTCGLAENRAAGAPIELAMVGDRQVFAGTGWPGALEFHMTTPPRDGFKSKSAQYTCDFSSRKPLKPGQGSSPTRTLR